MKYAKGSEFIRSNAIGLLALFVALGGVAWGASKAPRNSVVSSSIKNGQVKAKDLKRNAVRSSKVKNGGLTGRDLRKDSITGAQVDESSLDLPGGGDITGVSAGDGLTGGGGSGDVGLEADPTYLQRRVADPCGADSAITAIAESGAPTCEPFGDITGITAGSGLSGGGGLGNPTLSVTPGGIDDTHLAPGSVGTAQIIDGDVGAQDLGTESTILSVPAPWFTRADPTDVDELLHSSSLGFLYVNAGGTLTTQAVAPVPLPAGAVVTRLECWGFDNSGATDVVNGDVVLVKRLSQTALTIQQMANVDLATSGRQSATAYSEADTSISGPTVSAGQPAWLRLAWQPGETGTAQFFTGCEITYTGRV